ncbi:hypothetical protein [Thaumasiovibrio subtropicus]|uniref:hypothetical protein n=1 Tax=Thaumasiovibrio subtropicus TaxID=1891207 RepID=UPI000B35568C|nr:hypothetical protein [Thaumasiovibrio subtropicus]
MRKMLFRAALCHLLLWTNIATASTGVGIFVGQPYWGVEAKFDSLRVNVSLDEQFGFGVNKLFPVSNTPMYLFVGGHYVDRRHDEIALAPGIGASMTSAPMTFYVDLSPSLYLDSMAIDWEAKLGFRVNF